MHTENQIRLLGSPKIKQKHAFASRYGISFGPSVGRLVEDFFWRTVTKGVKWCAAEKPILKILRPEEWTELLEQGLTSGAPIDQLDGYIHFSTEAQVSETVSRHFKDAQNLVLLTYDASTLGPSLKFEPSRGGQLFPHLYAPLRLEDAFLIRPWTD